MAQTFIQVAIPVLYVYDQGTLPDTPPGFDMSLLPVISRVLKEHAGTPNVTVITGAPTLLPGLDTAYTQLALQYPNLQKASPDAGNLILAELAAENFNPDSVRDHLNRLIEAREAGLRDAVRERYGEVVEGAEEFVQQGLGTEGDEDAEGLEEEGGDEGEDEEDEGEDGGPGERRSSGP